jgi:hypothetical protein
MVRLGLSLAAAAHAERVRLGALGRPRWMAFLNILHSRVGSFTDVNAPTAIC